MPLMFSEPPSPPQGAPEWAITYADMVTLLLTFFVMLVSISEVNREGTYQDLVESVQTRFGIGAAPTTQPGSLRPRNAAIATLASSARARRGEWLQSEAEKTELGGSPGARSLLARIAFEEGRAELPAAARETLADVAIRTTGKSATIEIRGLAPRDRIGEAVQRAQACGKQLLALGIDSRSMRIAVSEGDDSATSTMDHGNGSQGVRVELYLLETPAPVSEPAAR